MKRSNELTTPTGNRASTFAAMAIVLVGALLLGACGGTSLSESHQATHKSSKGTCQSFISCLTAKTTHQPSPQTSAPGPRSTLGPSSLGPLESELPPADQQLMLSAMSSLSPSAASTITSHLNALSATDAARLGNDLSGVLSADPADSQAYAGALVGTGGTGVVTGVANAELQEFASALGQLPAALAQGDSQIASLVSELLSTTVPHIEQMMQNSLSQIPAPEVPIALADLHAGLAKASPTEVGDYVALLEDPSAEALATRTAYQAGYACGSTLYGSCSPFDQWVLSVSGLKTAPSLVQQDIVGCVLLPLCTQVEYEGVISWVDQVAAASSASAAEVQGLSAEMEANSFIATERWMGAF